MEICSEKKPKTGTNASKRWVCSEKAAKTGTTIRGFVIIQRFARPSGRRLVLIGVSCFANPGFAAWFSAPGSGRQKQQSYADKESCLLFLIFIFYYCFDLEKIIEG